MAVKSRVIPHACKTYSKPNMVAARPPIMATSPPNRMSIEDDIASSPFVHVLTRNSAIQRESAHLPRGLIHPRAWKGNSAKFVCRILHRTPSQGLEDGF